jgi:hypothetical protein
MGFLGGLPGIKSGRLNIHVNRIVSEIKTWLFKSENRYSE